MVRIRLARRGRKKLPRFDVVVADARAPRDGRFIEKIGTYDPLTIPATIHLDEEKAFQWLMRGAQPSDTVRAMLSYRGILLRKHLQIGVIKGAITQEEADRRLAEWKKAKEAKIQAKRERVISSRAAQAEARREAERKIREARAEALRKKAEAQQEANSPSEESSAETSS
jgi:small subunit ribosomal protein S16